MEYMVLLKTFVNTSGQSLVDKLFVSGELVLQDARGIQKGFLTEFVQLGELLLRDRHLPLVENEQGAVLQVEELRGDVAQFVHDFWVPCPGYGLEYVHAGKKAVPADCLQFFAVFRCLVKPALDLVDLRNLQQDLNMLLTEALVPWHADVLHR